MSKYLSTFYAGDRFCVYSYQIPKDEALRRLKQQILDIHPISDGVSNAVSNAVDTDYIYRYGRDAHPDYATKRSSCIKDALTYCTFPDNASRVAAIGVIRGLVNGLAASGMLFAEIMWHIAKAIKDDPILLKEERMIVSCFPALLPDTYKIEYDRQKAILEKIDTMQKA